MSMGNTCKIVTGRLLEIDVGHGYRSVEDVDDMIAMMTAEFARVPEPTRIVIAADWRACRVLTPEVATRVAQMLSRSNSRIERSAILHREEQAISVLQVLRLTREAQHVSRRVFTDPDEMKAWLGEVLTPAEVQRLDLHLAPEG